MSETFVPTDLPQRRRIARSLDETLLVEAGAGTGKTAALVSRIVSLVASGRATVDRIAAITFTRAAAAELRERLRRALEETATSPHAGEEQRRRCLTAARHLEHASIDTLHGFAASLLKELPLEAGLPPSFDTLEEIEGELRFAERWRQMVDELLESQDVAPLLSSALRLGLRLDRLRDVAGAFHKSYDLLSGPFARVEPPRAVAAASIAEARRDIRRLLPLARNGPDDPLAERAGRVAALGDRLAALGPGSPQATGLMARWGNVSARRLGNQRDWDNDSDSGVNGCKLLKELLGGLEKTRAAELEAARTAALLPVLEELRRLVLDYAKERRNAGQAEFHDLLVWARDLLRDNPAARAHFQHRFSHVLIDELQDTDPIQAEIAFYLAAQDDHTVDARRRRSVEDWTKLTLVPGKLFMVGDPKQSIYRFRRADMATLARLRSLLGDAAVSLVQNFRSQEPVLSWVNAVFSRWMGEGQDGLQAPYVPLAARWSPPEGAPTFGVHWFGGETAGNAEQVRAEEAASIASFLKHVTSPAWKVRDGDGGALRAVRHQDICILVPTRTGVPALERALDEAGVPYRMESQTMVLGSQDVHELLACLRAIDAPADQVALVAALRSSPFGCSDQELLEHVEAGGRIDYVNPGRAAGPVQDALDTLAGFHRARTWEAPDELIDRFIRERRMVEACFARARPRERWRRLRFVAQRARAFAHVGGSSLRAFLDWMERQAEEGARAIEAPVPEIDEDAVRIMTAHAAKGLEFPIVLLAGLGSGLSPRLAPVLFDRATGAVEVRVGGGDGAVFSTPGYESQSQREVLEEEAEAVRLMYVAATRARDHLVLSLYRPRRADGSLAATIARLAGETPGLWREVRLSGLGEPRKPAGPGAAAAAPDTPARREEWVQRRAGVIRNAARPAAVGATRLAQADKQEAESGDAPYRRGRAGTSLGRAVHSTLQTVDLATGANLDAISRAQANAESIPGRWREVARLARVGLESPVVKRAVATGRYYREVFVSAPVGGILVEGFIDLLFEAEGGLVIVDYKTDATGGEDVERAAERYRSQVGAYALAVSQVTGRSIEAAMLLFLHSGRQVAFEDVAALQSLARERALELAGSA